MVTSARRAPDHAALRVDSFVEKPDPTAQDISPPGGYLWNSGMFAFTANAIARRAKRFRPDVAGGRAAPPKSPRDIDFFRLEPDAFAAAGDSVDYAVMERTAAAAVVRGDIGWSDVGAWSALWDVAEKDETATSPSATS